MKRLSVIIPGYNTPAEMWKRCLLSVARACGPEDEIICVDDGSRERPLFLKELAAQDGRIQVVFLEHNGGQANARNVAIDLSAGKYIAFVDSDDEMVEGIHTEAVAMMETIGADIALFGVRVIWTAERLFKDDVPPSWESIPLKIGDVRELFSRCLFEYPVNRVYRKTFLDANRIRFDTGICPGEDTVLNLKTLLADAKFCFIPRVGYIYYRSYTSSLARYQSRFDESLRLRNDLWRQVNRKLGVTDESKMFGILSPSELLYWSIENKWRFDTPLSAADRYRFLVENKANLPSFPIAAFLKAEVKRWMRRYVYFRPIRRWKAKRMFLNVENLP